tara:strand:+ start:87 stop:659 length:573 start_codon:yes stop_codon:yes gene_type:complete
VLLKLFSAVFGIGVPIITSYALSMFYFGPYALKDEASCFAVEFPNNNQYSEDMTLSDPTNFIGLKTVNVTEQFARAAMLGFYLEIAILVFVLIGIPMGRWKKTSNLLGYTSVAWFVYIFYLRYSHFGKVCSGDFLESGVDNTYGSLSKAASFLTIYFGAISTMVSALFFMVLFYSCCMDSGKKSTDDDEE